MKLRFRPFIAVGLLLAAVGCSDDGSDADVADCFRSLLEVASTNTDSFPRLRLLTDVGSVGGDGATVTMAETTFVADDVRCVALDRAPNITYVAFDGDSPSTELDGDEFAAEDGIAVLEPGGDAADRLAGSEETWSDVDGALDLVDELLSGGPDEISLGLGGDDEPAVLLAQRQSTSAGSDDSQPTVEARTVVHFRDADAAGSHLAAVEEVAAVGGNEVVNTAQDDDVVTIDTRGPLAPDLFDIRRAIS